jgi:indolepyruvate ferredoxin oxidoreductase alpha subunit
MGASLSMAHGMELAGIHERSGRPVVGVIGDSTFAHSGITSLLGTIYNGGVGTLCILDNRTTAMTGTQGNPVNGVTLTDSAHGVSPLDVVPGKPLDLPALLAALGVEDIQQVDSQDRIAVRTALKAAVANEDELSVIIFKSPCRLVDRTRKPAPVITDCRRCGQCISIGCPALGKDADGRAAIDPVQCIGCGQCVQSCPFGFIQEA